VVLVVVGHEGQRRILVDHPRLEDIPLPGDHLIEATRLVDDVGEFDGPDHGINSAGGQSWASGGPTRQIITARDVRQ